LSSALVVTGLLLGGQAALAAPFCFQYSDTITTSGSFPAGLTTGDSVTVIVKVDNTGSTLNGQTWTSAHLQSVTFDFKNGTLKTIFTSPFGGGLDGTTGNFVTNGAGTLTAVPSEWGDGYAGTDVTTNGAAPPNSWYLDNTNDKYYEILTTSVGFSVPNRNQTPGNWSNVTCPVAAPIPPVSAPIFNFNQPAVIYSEEIDVTK